MRVLVKMILLGISFLLSILNLFLKVLGGIMHLVLLVARIAVA